MEAKIAVATVSGKAYYYLVNELKARGIDFLSLTPYELVPLTVQVVITTEEERALISHPQVLVYKLNSSPTAVVDEAAKLIRGKKTFETIAIGVDPGKTFGIAVLSDGNVLETLTCTSLDETAKTIAEIFSKHQAAFRMVKVGNLAPSYTSDFLPLLDETLPKDVTIEVVHEAGTSRLGSQTVHKRRLRHAMAAVKIAERRGQIYLRKGATENQ
ncbi:MAG TPA: hypothetical protein VJ249_02370 [Candidatus Bathyarchaeia archaeon]|nr:hypothetical protein [Candidatus Bathyarchaeia archaeon]